MSTQDTESLLTRLALPLHWYAVRIVVTSVALVLFILTLSWTEPSVYSIIPTISRHSSNFAYSSYATDEDALCNSLMLFESLQRLGSTADRILLHPEGWTDSISDRGARLLDEMLKLEVKLLPIAVQQFDDVDPTWAKGFTKLLAFNQTQYSRVLSLDSDAIIQQNLDELFHLPSSPVAMPRAYWLDGVLNAQMILVEPSAAEAERIQRSYAERPKGWSEMDLLNRLYGKHCLVIPHRPWAILSGEWRVKEHSNYMGDEPWDPEAAMREAKFVHFSDWPLRKPWQQISQTEIDELFPPCKPGSDCRSRELWIGLYAQFLTRRKAICGADFLPKHSAMLGSDR